MITKEISLREAFPVFYCEDNFNKVKVDGSTREIFLKHDLQKKMRYAGTYKDGVLMGVVSFKGGCMKEVHTYILPHYRDLAIEILFNQINFFKTIQTIVLFTFTSDKSRAVQNLLVNKIGFRVTSEMGHTVLIDSVVNKVYRLSYYIQD